MKVTSYLKVVFFSFLLTSGVFAQTSSKVVGKIFTVEEAAKLFGPVLTSVKLKVSELQAQLSKTDDYTMFRIKDNDIQITDSRRNVLLGKSIRLSADDVMHKYSTSKVKELLSKSKSDYISFEMRKEKFTVTYGNFTLELCIECPPFCE